MPNGAPPEHPDRANLVTPGEGEGEGAEQEPTKRHAWSKPKVQVKPTRAEKREFDRADEQAPRS